MCAGGKPRFRLCAGFRASLQDSAHASPVGGVPSQPLCSAVVEGDAGWNLGCGATTNACVVARCANGDEVACASDRLRGNDLALCQGD